VPILAELVTRGCRAVGVDFSRSSLGQGRELCPGAAVVSPRMSAYSEASKAVFSVFEEMAPTVEGLSIDEAFLDVRGLDHIIGTPIEIAMRLRREIRERVGLPITVGVARTKFLAKVASGVAKPDGLLLVPPDFELAFLHPLPVERLWGVGKVTSRKLRANGITTVGEVAALSEGTLVSLLGRASGRHLHALAHNHDPRPVVHRPRRRSIGAQRALGRRRRTREELATALMALVDRVTRRLRTAARMCRTIVLRLRFQDFTRATRSFTLPEPTCHTPTILMTATGLLRTSMPMIERRGCTLIGIALANLIDQGPIQLLLPLDRARNLDATIDRVRDRFGSGAITRGALVGQDPGVVVPLLPD